MLANLILTGFALLILEIIGFRFSVGPWIFLSVLFPCFTFIECQGGKNKTRDSSGREEKDNDEK